MRDMDYLQADNEMKTFASVTGGMSFFPTFIRRDAGYLCRYQQNIRAKYQLVYQSHQYQAGWNLPQTARGT